jgi:hypothetical protein
MTGERRIKEKPDPELEKMLKEDAGKGVSTALYDTAFWIDHDDPGWSWYLAMEDIDKRGNKTALLALLRQQPEPHFHHLADLLERYTLKHKPGRRRTPSYDRTAKQALLELAIPKIRAAVGEGIRVKQAVEQCWKAYRVYSVSISEEELILAYRGSLGSMNKMKKRQPKPKK